VTMVVIIEILGQLSDSFFNEIHESKLLWMNLLGTCNSLMSQIRLKRIRLYQDSLRVHSNKTL
ncbi:MAG: hypothetical protein ACKOW8_04320, partial [Flavobacteriales bacterium]